MANFCTGNSERIANYLQTEQRLDQAREQVSTNNDLIKKYLKTQYHYEFCTTCVSISFKAFEDKATKERILGGSDADYENFLTDIRFELSKFGPIEQLKVPKLNEQNMGVKSESDEPGKAYVEFLNVSSAFACYNLLNGKPYLG